MATCPTTAMFFEHGGRKAYYEVYGEGEPLLLLNGVFMSSASWRAFVPAFSAQRQLILLDFLDQGQSDHMTEDYSQDVQAELVLALLQHLGISSVDIVGISYGGEVAMRVALRQPGTIRKLTLANTTPYTSPWLRDMGKAWEHAIASHDGRKFFKACIPPVYSPGFYSRNIEWLRQREDTFVEVFTPAIYDAFLRLIRSAEDFDVRSELPKLDVDTLVVSSEQDFVTPFEDQALLVSLIPGAKHITIRDAGHASMYEQPEAFVLVILGFLQTPRTIKVI